jgi:hypothetical protein
MCVWSVRADFQLKRKSVFYTIYQTDDGPKNKINKKHSRACVVAAAIRTFVSEFVCHPVQEQILKSKVYGFLSWPIYIIYAANLAVKSFRSEILIEIVLPKTFLPLFVSYWSKTL